MQSPTDELKQEHVYVLMVVEAMEHEVAHIEAGGAPHAERVAQMMEFTRRFTDGYHHYKEEQVLFPVLEERDRGAAGQISILLSEHEAGREAVRGVLDNLPRADEDEAARAAVGENLKVYAMLLRFHINKEDTVLFPLADELLSDQEAELMAEDFGHAEEESGADPAHYRALAEALSAAPAD